MSHIKHCAIVVRRAEDLWEATRTTLGLAVHNFYAYLFVIDFVVDATEALKENLNWLEELECQYISNVEVNGRHNFKVMPSKKIIKELKRMDLIIPFGK